MEFGQSDERETMKKIWAGVYNVAEMAVLLDMSDWVVYERAKRREIPGVRRYGSKIRFIKAVINRWLGIDARSTSTNEPTS